VQLCLRREQAPSIDSVLKSLLTFGLITPKHLGVIHKTRPRSVLRVLEAAAKLEEPLVRPVGTSPSGPLAQCYLLTKAGREKAERQYRIDRARRVAQGLCLASPIYMQRPHGQTYRRPDLLLTRDGTVIDLDDPPHLSGASSPGDRWACLQRFLEER
jgi:hypothetical protein